VVEPAAVDAWVSLDAESRTLATVIEVTGPRRPLASAERVFLSEAQTTDVDRSAV
jgi:hypothetical protein